MILVPAIDILGGRAVRLKKGDYAQVTVYNEDAVAQAAAFEAAGAERVHIVDLDGARDGAPTNMELIKRMVAQLSCEVEVGGGIRSMEAIQRYVDAGVRRVVLGSALVKDRSFALEAAREFGPVIVAGVDAKDGIVATEGWLDTADGVPQEELIGELEAMGIRHLVYTDIARDGMQTGLDAQAYAAMARAFPGVRVTSPACRTCATWWPRALRLTAPSPAAPSTRASSRWRRASPASARRRPAAPPPAASTREKAVFPC